MTAVSGRPHRISWHSLGMDDIPPGDGWMDSAERTRIGQMTYTKRRMESTLSRFTAKTTVARALGLDPGSVDLTRVTIRNAADGAPEAFLDGDDAEVVVAMTDRADWAVCSVLHGPARIGCDLELVEQRSDVFVRDYFTPTEQHRVTLGPPAERDLLANLIWSAKESALKVLRTGLRLDTRSVSVDVGPLAGGAGWSSLAVEHEGLDFPGWWQRFGDFVLTVVAAEPVAEPEALVEPPGLAGAVPSHRWLEAPVREH